MSKELQKELEAMEARIIAAVKQELDPKFRKEKDSKKVHHNAKKLLRNYSKFVQHYEVAEFTASNLIDKELIQSINHKLDEGEIDEVYIKSLFQTKERTAIMLNHINKVLAFYEYTAMSDNDSKRIRLSSVLRMTYIERQTAEQVATILNIDRATVFRDINEGIEDIKPLLFGIDGIKFD